MDIMGSMSMEVEVLYMGTQMIHTPIKNKHGCASYIIYVYGKNNKNEGQPCGINFGVSRMINSACWVAVGDFDDALYEED